MLCKFAVAATVAASCTLYKVRTFIDHDVCCTPVQTPPHLIGYCKRSIDSGVVDSKT